MKSSTKKWVEDSVKYFKNMGFFQDGFDLEKIHEYLRDVYFDEYLEQQPKTRGWGGLDSIILLQDTKRVSRAGDEIINANNASKEYSDSINHWGAISNGVFTPANINFQWITKFDIFTINFDFNGSRFKFRSDESSRISVILLYRINKLLQGTDCFFYECNAEGIECQVIALTELEKDKLMKERGWDCHLGIE